MTLATLSLLAILSNINNQSDFENTHIQDVDSVSTRLYTEDNSVRHVDEESRAPINSSILEWFEFVDLDAQAGECFEKVSQAFPRCTNLDKSVSTRDWNTGDPRYIMRVTCHKYISVAFISAEINSPEHSEILSSGTTFCEDNNRVWVRANSFQY